MKDSVVGIGIVGAGAIAIRSALMHFQEDESLADRAKITAIFDPVYERAKAAAEKYGVPAAYSTYEELLADPNVDAVSICSPIGFHHEQVMMALKAGKHVHSNKTITTTRDEVDEIMTLSDEKKIKVVASPGMMLMPHNQRMRRAVLEGRLGDITMAITGDDAGSGSYHINEPYRHGDDILNNINPTWYFKKPGGGPLYDVTVYSLNILTGVLGPAKRVHAFSGQKAPTRVYQGQVIENETDDTTMIHLDFGNQVYALCYSSTGGGFDGKVGGFTPFIFGTKGRLDGAKLNGELLTRDTDHEPHVTGIHGKLPENHVFEDIMQLVDWVREDKPSIANLDHARHVIDIIDSAYRSAETGANVDLAETKYRPLPLEELAEI